MFDHEMKKFWDDGLGLYLSEYEKCIWPFVAKDGSVVYCNIRGKNQHKMHVCTPSPGANWPQRCLEAEGEFLHRRSWSPAAQEAWRTGIKKRFQNMYHRASLLSSPLNACLSSDNRYTAPITLHGVSFEATRHVSRVISLSLIMYSHVDIHIVHAVFKSWRKYPGLSSARLTCQRAFYAGLIIRQTHTKFG